MTTNRGGVRPTGTGTSRLTLVERAGGGLRGRPVRGRGARLRRPFRAHDTLAFSRGEMLPSVTGHRSYFARSESASLS
jgi:hypothetical protein